MGRRRGTKKGQRNWWEWLIGTGKGVMVLVISALTTAAHEIQEHTDWIRQNVPGGTWMLVAIGAAVFIAIVEVNREKHTDNSGHVPKEQNPVEPPAKGEVK